MKSAFTTEREVRIPSRAGSWLWFFCFQFFVCEQIARLGWAGHYSMTRDYISDLGAVHCGIVSADLSAGASVGACSSLHWVMNASFILQGCLTCAGAILARGFFPATRIYRVALILFFVAGVGVLIVGLVPQDTNFSLHIVGAVANFTCGNLAMILLGWAMIRRSSAPNRKGWIALTAGAAGMLAAIALAFRGTPAWTEWGLQAGTVERIAAYPIPLWLCWTGFLLLRARR